MDRAEPNLIKEDRAYTVFQIKDDHACSGVNSVPDPFWKWTKLEKARLSGLLTENGGV
jgi:hypothetical protein